MSTREDVLASSGAVRVLVVDDEPRNRRLLRAVLQSEGYEVVEAADGPSAVEAVSRGAVDVALLDVTMPGMDGYETCARIRALAVGGHTPVVFVTAVGDRASRVRGKEIGADDFLVKPIDETELLVRVRNLAKAKAFDDLREQQRVRLEQELERRAHQLLRADRLATLGTLAGGVGHEINNMNQVLFTYLGFVEERAAQGLPPEAEDLAALRRVAEHYRVHAANLLALGRPGPDHASRVDLRDVVTSVLAMLAAVGRTRHAQVVLENGPALFVPVSRERLEQVFVNLVGNAVDAVEGQPAPRKVTIVLQAEGARTECSVEDNGCGIPADRLATVFDAYYTTKEPGRGTGLGLPVVRQIVESYGGRIAVTSVEAKGTRFAFDLPREA